MYIYGIITDFWAMKLKALDTDIEYLHLIQNGNLFQNYKLIKNSVMDKKEEPVASEQVLSGLFCTVSCCLSLTVSMLCLALYKT